MYKLCLFLFLPMLLSANIHVSGSTTILPVVKDAAKIFSKTYAIVTYVKGGGSSQGLAALESGECEIAMVSKPLTEDQQKRFKTYALAYDGLAMIVHKNNPLQKVTREEVIEIYSGEKQVWENGEKITVVDKNAGRGTKKVFDNYFKVKKMVAGTYEVGSNTETLLYVSTDRSAIGYVSIGAAEKGIEKGLPIKMLELEGIAPSAANINNGSYPLRRTLSLLTARNATPKTQSFIDYLLGKEGEKFIRKHHYIPIVHEKL